jgi:hypothetical protein
MGATTGESVDEQAREIKEVPGINNTFAKQEMR